MAAPSRPAPAAFQTYLAISPGRLGTARYQPALISSRSQKRRRAGRVQRSHTPHSWLSFIPCTTTWGEFVRWALLEEPRGVLKGDPGCRGAPQPGSSATKPCRGVPGPQTLHLSTPPHRDLGSPGGAGRTFGVYLCESFKTFFFFFCFSPKKPAAAPPRPPAGEGRGAAP